MGDQYGNNDEDQPRDEYGRLLWYNEETEEWEVMEEEDDRSMISYSEKGCGCLVM